MFNLSNFVLLLGFLAGSTLAVGHRNESELLEEYGKILIIEFEQLNQTFDAARRTRDLIELEREIPRASYISMNVLQEAISQFFKFDWPQIAARFHWTQVELWAKALNQTVRRVELELNDARKGIDLHVIDYNATEVRTQLKQLVVDYKFNQEEIDRVMNQLQQLIHDVLHNVNAYWSKQEAVKILNQAQINLREFEGEIFALWLTEPVKAKKEKRNFPLDLQTELNYWVLFAKQMDMFAQAYLRYLNSKFNLNIS